VDRIQLTGPMAVSLEHGNKPLGSMKVGQSVDQLSDF
jgi:hypothetical protein